jgi:hypothetical protein
MASLESTFLVTEAGPKLQGWTVKSGRMSSHLEARSPQIFRVCVADDPVSRCPAWPGRTVLSWRCLGLGDPIGCLAPLLEQGIENVASALPGKVNGDWAGGDDLSHLLWA